MVNIFLSYSRNNEAIAKTLAVDIEALGHTVWFDQELNGGQTWWNQILEKVNSCDVFVLLLDPETLNSEACKREYGYAADLGKSILPVLVSNEVSTNLLPPALSQIQFVDYRELDRNAAFRLARSLTTVPPPKPLPDPLPSPPEVPISYLGGLAARVETTSRLSYEEQSTLVFDLKGSLSDLGTNNDTWTLVEKLRKRRDLLVPIAEEIDELLRSRVLVPKPSSLKPPPPLPIYLIILRDAFFGTIIGAVIGVVIGVVSLSEDNMTVVGMGFVFAMLGAIIGAITGAIKAIRVFKKKK